MHWLFEHISLSTIGESQPLYFLGLYIRLEHNSLQRNLYSKLRLGRFTFDAMQGTNADDFLSDVVQEFSLTEWMWKNIQLYGVDRTLTSNAIHFLIKITYECYEVFLTPHKSKDRFIFILIFWTLSSTFARIKLTFF